MKNVTVCKQLRELKRFKYEFHKFCSTSRLSVFEHKQAKCLSFSVFTFKIKKPKEKPKMPQV